MTGGVGQRRGKQADDEPAQISGDRNKLFDAIRGRYGIEKGKAERQKKEWSANA